MGKLVIIPARPNPKRRTTRQSDPRYIEGQKMLVEAIRYLVQTDPDDNKPAIHLLSEHFRTNFRMEDRP